MIEKLKAALELFDFIGKYPFGIKALGGLWLLHTMALGAGLLVYYPKPKAAAAPLRIVGLDIQKLPSGRSKIDVRVQNNTANSAEITGIKLSFFADPDPTLSGALQTTREITGKYHVLYNGKGATAAGSREGGDEGLKTQIYYPAPGRTDYAFLSMTLEQSVPHNDADRFTVTIDATDFPPPAATHLRAVLYYNGDEETPPMNTKMALSDVAPPSPVRKP